MSAYVPPGYIIFEAALAHTAQAAFPDAYAALDAVKIKFLRHPKSTSTEGPAFRGFMYRSQVIADAYARLRPHLADGSLPISRRTSGYGVQPLEPEGWHSGNCDELGLVLDSQDMEGPLLLKTGDLEAVLRGEPAPSLAAASHAFEQSADTPTLPTTERAPSTGGNRSNPEVDRFWIEICRHIADGEIEDGRTGLIKIMAQWSSDNMRKPYDERTVGRKIAHLFDKIGWE